MRIIAGLKGAGFAALGRCAGLALTSPTALIPSEQGIHKLDQFVVVQLFSEQNFIITSSVGVRKAVFETTGLFDEQLVNCQDWDMWLRIAFYFQIAGIDKPLVKYRHNPHSLSKNRDNVLKYQKLVIDKIYHMFNNKENGMSEKLYKKRLALHYAKTGRNYLRIGDERLAHENFRLSVKHDLLNLRTLRYYFRLW